MNYKKIILVSFLFLNINISNAQTTSPCDDKEISTNPDNFYGIPTASLTSNTLRMLNWLQSAWDWQKQNTAPNTIIQNPFLASGNSNVQSIVNSNPANTDNRPDDGWELLSYNDGSKYDGVNQWRQSDFDFPYLILYNKYRAIIRTFILYELTNPNQDYDYATISLQYLDNNKDLTLQSAILSNYASIQKSIDAFDKKTHAQSANTVTLNTYQWQYADFPIAYDPCVCDFTYSKLKISVSLVDNADVKLNGTTATFIATNKNGTTIIPSLGFAGGSEIGKDLTKGLKVFKDDKELITNLLALYGSQAKGTEKADSAKKQSGGGTIQKELFEILKLGGATLPYAGLIFSVIDNFSTDSKPAGPSQVAFSAKTDLDGTISYTQNGAINAFLKVPGSLPPSNLLDEEKPLYDEPLGVFNLLNTPELEYVDYYTHYDVFGDFGFTNSTNAIMAQDFHPFIRQYKIKTVPQVVINPSADLDLVDLKYTLRVGYFAHPTDKNTIFHQSMNTMLCWVANDNFTLSNSSAINMENFYDYKGFFVHDRNVGSLNSPHFVTVKPFPVIDFSFVGAGNWQGYNTDIDKKMKKIGLAYENWPKAMPYADPKQNVRGYINTNYLPYSWMPFQTFYTFSGAFVSEAPQCGNASHYPSEGGKPIFELKVQAMFKRKNEPNSSLISHTITYPVKLVKSDLDNVGNTCTINKFDGACSFILNANGVSNTSIWKDPLRIPFDIRLENETVGPGDIVAINNISFGDNVIVLPNTNFYAGNTISIEGQNTQIPPQSILEIREVPTGVTPLASNNYLATDVKNACSSKSTYSPIVQGNKVSKKEVYPINENIISKIYPNPASSSTSLAFSSTIAEPINITITDVSGKLISTLNYNATIGSNKIEINTQSLISGFYFVALKSSTINSIHKLSIQKQN